MGRLQKQHFAKLQELMGREAWHLHGVMHRALLVPTLPPLPSYGSHNGWLSEGSSTQTRELSTARAP
jgi:hypothetical protein